MITPLPMPLQSIRCYERVMFTPSARASHLSLEAVVAHLACNRRNFLRPGVPPQSIGCYESVVITPLPMPLQSIRCNERVTFTPSVRASHLSLEAVVAHLACNRRNFLRPGVPPQAIGCYESVVITPVPMPLQSIRCYERVMFTPSARVPHLSLEAVVAHLACNRRIFFAACYPSKSSRRQLEM